jgi:hypothetical protein
VVGYRFTLLFLAAGFLSGLVGPAGSGPFETASAARAGSNRGVAARSGYIAFETFGRDDSLIHVEVLPYTTANEHTLFSDLRLFSVEGGALGGNFGFGYRRSMAGSGRFLGASVWYDFDDSTGELFNQLGVSLESCGAVWDARANLYFPVGDDEKTYGLGVLNQQFVENRITYDGLRRFGEAMEGFDLEFGLLLPTEAAANHDVRAAVGYYHFAGDAVPDIDGFRLRGEGNVSDNVTMQVELTDDRTFGTNITLGVAIVLPGGFRRESPPGSAAPVRIDRFVRRNYNVIVSRHAEVQTGLTAINPDTGLPYVVEHVSSSSGGLNLGTVDDPFATIGEAQAVPGDLIFVHSGSVLSEPVVLAPDQEILGEGVRYDISYGLYGNHALPTATGGSARPTLEAVAATAVTLASGSRFSGFVIDSPTGHGIFGDGVSDALVTDVDVVGAAMDGVLLQNPGGGNFFDRIYVCGAGGNGINVQGGGSIRFGNATVEGAAAAGINIEGTTGLVEFASASVTGSSGSPGVRIVDAPGDVSFDDLSVTADNATGLYVRDSGKLVIGDGEVASIGGSAVDAENVELDVDLTSVSSDGAAVGVRLVNTPGEFFVYGDGAYGTGGVIQNAGTGVLLSGAGSVGFNYLDMDANGTGVDAADTTYFILAHARVTNSINYAINARNTATLEVLASTFSANGGAGTNAIRAAADADGDYVINVLGNTFTDNSAAALAILTSGAGDGSSLTLLVDQNKFTTTRAGADAVNLAWNGAAIAKFLNNTFTASAGSNDGLDVTMSSTTELAQLVATGNTFAFSGADAAAIRLVALGPSYSYIGTNELTFNGAGGVGVDFSLAKSAEVHVDDNTIVDKGGGGTGILFQAIDGPSVVTVNGNTISLVGPTAAIDRGIIFNTVTGTVTLVAQKNNLIDGATIPFYVPQGTTSGYLLINGMTLP